MSDNDEVKNEDAVSGEDAEIVRILAVSITDKHIGLACYDELTNSLRSDGFDTSAQDLEAMLISAKMVCQPTLILVHPRVVVNTPMLNMVTCGCDGTPGHYPYQAVKSSNWNVDTALELMCTKFSIRDGKSRADVESLSYQDNFLRLSSHFDMNDRCMIQCIGALLHFMQTYIFYLDNGMVSVNGVQGFALGSYLRMDPGTSQSLQIFSTDYHPNVLKGTGKSKEGFSVYGLLDRTNSLPGRRRLREWLLLPYCDRSLIMDRQDGIAMAVRADNIDFVGSVMKLLKRIHDVPVLLLRIKKATASFTEWHRIFLTLEAALPLWDHCEIFVQQQEYRDPSDISYVQGLLSCCNIQVIRNLFHSLSSAIDFSMSKSEGGILTVREGYCPELDRLRFMYDHLDDALVATAKRVLEAAPLLQHVSVEYVPQIGYLIAVDAAEQHFLTASSGGNADEYQFVYANEGKLYFKHAYVLGLDDSIGDIKSHILDKQKELVLDIENELLDGEFHMIMLSRFLENMDATLSLGVIANELGCTRPDIVEEQVLVIKAGRHPLQELTVDVFVPNDTFLSEEKSLGVITGANGSGKSVYLKQVGLLVYLAHVGCFLPCERAIIGLTDRILTRVASTETVANPLSSFALDLNQISRMLTLYTPRSLCLIDEFGKGTSPVDGMALLAAVVETLVTKPARALVVMHFHEILHKDIIDLDTRPRITAFKMDVHAEKRRRSSGNCNARNTYPPMPLQPVAPPPTSAATGGESYGCSDGGAFEDGWDACPSGEREVPLYRLTLGVARGSSGIECAERCGVPAAVVRRAREIAQVCLSPSLFIEPVDRQQYLTANYLCSNSTDGSKNTTSHSHDGLTLLTNSDVDAKKGAALLMHFLQVEDWESAAEEELGRMKALLAMCR